VDMMIITIVKVDIAFIEYVWVGVGVGVGVG
jgi:hypothetical protein